MTLYNNTILFDERIHTSIKLFFRIRSLGSAALNACMVASGRADAYYEQGVHCWDIAAAVVVVREAGGVCIMPTGEGGEREREREREREGEKWGGGEGGTEKERGGREVERERIRECRMMIVKFYVCMPLFISGEPLDVMKRALLCTSTQELASKIVPHMKHIDYAEDK
jgi:hypothetical protein